MEPFGDGAAGPPEVRRSRWSDLPEVFRLYRSRTEEERRQFHPLPGGRLRLAAALAGVQVAQGWSQRWTDRRPSWAVVLLVARLPKESRLAGFGAMRFRRAPDGALVAVTGLLVRPDRRRRHVATELKRSLLELAASAGAVRAEALVLATNEASLALNRRFGYEFREGSFTDTRGDGGRFLLAERGLPIAGAIPPGVPASRPPTPGPVTGTSGPPSNGPAPPLSERSPG